MKESFANIGEHCISVGFLTSRICGALVGAGLIQESDADGIIERALIHDITKPFEILRRNAVKSGLLQDAYTPAAYEALRPLLIESGLSSELANYLVNAGKETGHNSLKDFIVAGPNGLQGIVKDRIAEKIVHLADDMTFTSNPQPGEPAVTYFLTPQERMDASNFRSRYGFMWSEGLALDSNGKIVALRDLAAAGKEHQMLGNYADLQIKVSTAIAREFQLYLNPASTEPAELFIKRLAHS